MPRMPMVSACLLAAVLLPIAAGCGEAPPRSQPVSEVRAPDPADQAKPPAMTSEERLGLARQDPHAAHGGMPDGAGPPSAGLAWDTPQGWTAQAATPLRVANFTVDAAPGAECYLTVLAGDGGGLLANVNRWRKQMSQPEIGEADLAALPKKSMLGREAIHTVIDGTFVGMGGTQNVPEARLYGMALVDGGAAYFAKMTGPAAALAAQEQNFVFFCASLRKADTAQPEAPQPAAAPDAAATPPAEAPALPAPAPLPTAAPAGAPTWTAPEGWTEGAARPMRLVTFSVGASECYVTILNGDGGGVAGNLNRWRGQMGQPPYTDEEIAALPLIPMMGQSVPMLDAAGDFTNMAGQAVSGQRMLGAMAVTPAGAVFVKMTGPDAEVAAERDRFAAFCASLK